MALRNPQDIAQELARQRVQQTALQRFGQSAWNSFKQSPQQLGTAVGKAILAPIENRRLAQDAESDRRVQQVLYSQSNLASKAGDRSTASTLLNKAQSYGDRSFQNQNSFAQSLQGERGKAVGGAIGTGLTILGASRLTPLKAVTATAIPTVAGGAFAKLTGQDVASGAGAGLGQSLQLSGINKLTGPILSGAKVGRLNYKGIAPQLAKLPLAKRAVLMAGATGTINTAENELQTRINEQRGQTFQELALSFGMGAVTGAGGEVVPAGLKAGKQAVKDTKQNLDVTWLDNALKEERRIEASKGVQTRQKKGLYGPKTKVVEAVRTGENLNPDIPLIHVRPPGNQDFFVTPSQLFKNEKLQQYIVGPGNDSAKKLRLQAYSGGFVKPDEFIPGKVEEPKIDRTQLTGKQLDMTNAQLKEANQFQLDMEAQALNTQKTNTTSGTQTGKRPEVSQLFRAPEDLSPSQTSSPARENLSRLIQTRPEVFSKTGKSSQKSLVSSLPPEHYTELQQSFKDRTPDQKVNIIDYLRTPEKVLQKIGLGKEAELLKKQYNNYLDELPKEIGKITEWSKRVSPGANEKIFRYLDGQKGVPLAPEELKVATEIQGYLKEWADKLDLPQDSRIASYITHIFEKDFIQKEFDPEIARMIQDRVPGSVYDPFLQKRLGELGYVEDTWRALDAYVKRATRKYNMDQALEPLQKAAERLDIDSYKYVERLGARINLRPTELDNLMDNTIKSLIGYKFGQRPVAAISRNIRQAVYRGTLGLNVGSAVRNLTQGVNTYSELGEKYTLKGYLSLARDIASGSDELTRVGVLRDDFIQDRALSATKQSLQKLDKGLFALFEAAERINRGAAYYGAKSRALSQGKSEQQAIQEAIKLVEKTQFRFGSVDTPVAMQSDLAKLILQFQSYALKQGEFLAGKVANKEYAGLIRYALGSFVLAKTVGTLIGMDITDMIPGYGIATGEQKIGQTPAFQFGSSVVSAATDQPDDYGNKRTFKEKALDIGESAVPLIPAGVQIKKTLQGLDAVRKGYSESASGRIQYVVPQDAPTAIRAGLLGKSKLPQAQEYFNNEESVLSEKQTELVKTSPDMMGAYQNVLKQRKVSREEDKAREQVRETSNIQEVGEKILYYKDGEVNSVDIGKITAMPEKTGYERILKQREAYSTLSALYQSDTVTQDIKEKALSQVGITKENMEYYLVAKENNDVKTAYVYDKITEFATNQDRQGFLQWLAENRKDINGSQVVSDGVVSQLKSDGLLSAQESKLLKQITVDQNGKRLSKVTGRKPKKLKSFKPPAFKAPKQKRLQVRKGTRLKAIKV